MNVHELKNCILADTEIEEMAAEPNELGVLATHCLLRPARRFSSQAVIAAGVFSITHAIPINTTEEAFVLGVLNAFNVPDDVSLNQVTVDIAAVDANAVVLDNALTLNPKERRFEHFSFFTAPFLGGHKPTLARLRYDAVAPTTIVVSGAGPNNIGVTSELVTYGHPRFRQLMLDLLSGRLPMKPGDQGVDAQLNGILETISEKFGAGFKIE